MEKLRKELFGNRADKKIVGFYFAKIQGGTYENCIKNYDHLFNCTDNNLFISFSMVLKL